MWEESEDADSLLSGMFIARQSAAPSDEERDAIIEALNEAPETLAKVNKRYCKPSTTAALSSVERCLWRQIDPENFQEVWDEIQDGWGTPNSGVTAIFPVESVVIQKLLAEKNDDNALHSFRPLWVQRLSRQLPAPIRRRWKRI